MFRIIAGLLKSLFSTRTTLALENLALRQQALLEAHGRILMLKGL